MAAVRRTATDIQADIQQKKELLDLNEGLKRKATEDAQTFHTIPEEDMTEEQRRHHQKASDDYDHAEKMIVETTRDLNELTSELKRLSHPEGKANSIHTVKSTESSLRIIEARTKKVLVELKIAYEDDKQKLTDKLEDVEDDLTVADSDEDKKRLVAAQKRLQRKLERLERDYPTRCQHVKDKAQAEMDLVRVELEEEYSDRQNDGGDADRMETENRVHSWMNKQPSGNVTPEPAQPQSASVSEAQQPQIPVPVQQSIQPEPTVMDKDAVMLSIMQNQLKLMQTGNATTAERELPVFSGDPSQYGIFKSAFERTQAKFNFDNSANLGRLLKALKEGAYEAVKPLLTNEDNVPEILRILDMRYGRPECVLNYLVEKAKQCQRPDVSRPETVVEFGTAVHALVTNIVSYKRPNYMHNPHLVEELVEKLPGTLKGAWFDYRVNNDIAEVDLQLFSNWLSRKMESALLQIKTSIGNNDAKKEERQNRPRRNVGAINASEGEEKASTSCPACNLKGHGLHNCWTLKKKSLNERWNIVKAARVCYTCLKPNHLVKDCPESKLCGKSGCKMKHHPILHNDDNRSGGQRKQEGKKRSTSEKDGDNSNEGSVNLAVSIVKGTDSPLPIVPVRVKGNAGVRVIHALLDSGATRTLITKNLASELELTGPAITYRYRTFSGEVVESSDSMKVNLQISGRFRNAKMFPLMDAVTVDTIGLAPYSIDVDAAKMKWPHLSRFKGPSLQNVKPDLVIGGDHGYLMMHRDLLYTSIDQPVAMRTVLGWILQGKLSITNQVGSSFCMGGTELDATLNQLIEESFRVHDIAGEGNKTCMSLQDKKALEIMQSTTCQLDNGRWETGLLWKDDSPFSEDTYDEALSRLRKTERRMMKNPEFAATYKNKIVEYENKGFVRKLYQEKGKLVTERTCHIPHFGVTNPHKPGKFRFVFDCAAPVNGKSFNDHLLSGPDLIRPLTSVLWNFRRHKVVICGDVEDMFHRIFVRAEDREAQRFLWRDGDMTPEPDVYEMLVLIFGATSSPCSAIYVKDRNAETFKEQYPDAVKSIIQDMYVDDNLGGADTVADAIRLRQEITEVMGKGGLIIKKWISNSEEVMQSIPSELRLSGDETLAARGIGATERVLGLYWDPKEDIFKFKLNFAKVKEDVMTGRKPTKREMCSLIMSLFDPIGFVAHFKVKGLILFQRVWKSGVGWDDPITEDVHSEWKIWLKALYGITEMKIPRCYSLNLPEANVQLHTFVDASSEATSCVSYLRIEWNEAVEVSFVGAKVHVAPNKKTTIPRLELCAAVMGSKLASTILKELRVKVDRCFNWCDSWTVLCWIASESTRYKEFVGNRICKIHNYSDKSDWRWIDTASNVADDGTRLRKKADLTSESRWLCGPSFLKLPMESWPQRKENTQEFGMTMAAVSEEEQHENVKHFRRHDQGKMDAEVTPKLERFSSFYRLMRATAAVTAAARYWLSKVRNTEPAVSLPWSIGKEGVESFISSVDLAEGEKKLIRSSQYQEDVVSWSKSKKLKIGQDEDGIIRVSGRLDRASCLNEDAKMPIILPVGHRIVELLVDQEHRRNGHCGRNTVFNSLRHRFWIPDGRRAVRSSWTRCFTCKIKKAKPVVPEMGMIPSYRMAAFDPPFTYTGTDLFGPIEVTIGRRHEKRWGLLMTCLVTRGIHLEIISGLSTDETLMGISRFVDSRGLPRHFYSDNGTNYKGAAKEIMKRQKFYGTSWHFIPPASPHMGGAWETLVKQVKKVLDEITKEKFPKEQTLLTAVKAIENIVNSRPLSFVSDDNEDPVALTPNHFLRGVGIASAGPSSQAATSGSQFLGSDVPDEKEKWGKQWEKAQVTAKQFWNRWSVEVLPDLLLRNKWRVSKEPVKVGEVVILVDEQRPRGEWSKALVTKTFPGKDGIVRVVDVMTRSFKSKKPTYYRRAVAKICPLGIHCCDLTTASGVQIRWAVMEENHEAAVSSDDAIESTVAARK